MKAEVGVFVVSAAPPEVEVVINAEARVDVIVEVEGRLLFRYGEHGVIHAADSDVGVAVYEVFTGTKGWDCIAANALGLVFAVDVTDIVV